MARTAINVEHIARVEGHGNVRVVIEDGAVKAVEMGVVEPARLFESMVRGRSYTELSYIASRICGICSSSHFPKHHRKTYAQFNNDATRFEPTRNSLDRKSVV